MIYIILMRIWLTGPCFHFLVLRAHYLSESYTLPTVLHVAFLQGFSGSCPNLRLFFMPSIPFRHIIIFHIELKNLCFTYV